MPHEVIQVRRLCPNDKVARQSLVDGLEGDARSDWLTVVFITQTSVRVFLTVYDPDNLQDLTWTGDPLLTVHRST
jgi:hypothetical protein